MHGICTEYEYNDRNIRNININKHGASEFCKPEEIKWHLRIYPISCKELLRS